VQQTGSGGAFVVKPRCSARHLGPLLTLGANRSEVIDEPFHYLQLLQGLFMGSSNRTFLVEIATGVLLIVALSFLSKSFLFRLIARTSVSLVMWVIALYGLFSRGLSRLGFPHF
jgi:hypothetical protein